METDRDTIEMLVAAPAGVALLQSLEVECRSDVHWWESPVESVPTAVRAAVELVGGLNFGGVVQRAVAAADRIGGPWMPSAPVDLSNAYRLASVHRPIAEALVERFADALRAPFDDQAQEWWSSGPQHQNAWEARPWGHEPVYCCGEFSLGSLWTVTGPPDEVHHELIEMWELYPRPVGRWAMPVHPGTRVFEIHDVADWARLVATYPRTPTRRHGGWELPGPNQHLAEIAGIEIASGGRAARSGVTVLMPDWELVAADYDAVYLSWLGMLSAEGHVIEVPDAAAGVVTMLRYWRTERTHWLRDAFGDPSPLPAPVVRGDDGSVDSEIAIDVTRVPDRLATDRKTLRRRLGRDPA